jgi:hypothetical protein
VAIEFDGTRYHYVGGQTAGGLRGNDRLRNIILSRLGIPTLRITDTEWRRVAERGPWLRNRIGEARFYASIQ